METKDAVKRIIDAWQVEGRYPAYHRRQKEILKRNWPTLFNAVVALVARRHGAKRQ